MSSIMQFIEQELTEETESECFSVNSVSSCSIFLHLVLREMATAQNRFRRAQTDGLDSKHLGQAVVGNSAGDFDSV